MKSSNKSLHISEDVIIGTIVNAVMEVEGVSKIAPVPKTIKQLWFNKPNHGEIKIDMSKDVLSVAMGVILKNGVKALAVSENIQNSVKDAAQNMLGITVSKVNVTIRGIDN
ncbi:MAG: Asp23/Gls24 family envelope stress response protein [Oscillospiraceae bacterium]